MANKNDKPVRVHKDFLYIAEQVRKDIKTSQNIDMSFPKITQKIAKDYMEYKEMKKRRGFDGII